MRSDGIEVVGGKSSHKGGESGETPEPDGGAGRTQEPPSEIRLLDRQTCGAVNPAGGHTCTLPRGHPASDGCHFSTRCGLWYVAANGGAR
jgi:hypothetical protein